MGPRNLLILFFSTVAVSLVILVIFFSLFFKNIDLNFNTKLPQSAPDIGGMSGGMNPESKADGLLRSTVNVPPEIHEESPPPPSKKASPEPSDALLPPVSDDSVLNNEDTPPLPPVDEPPPPPRSRFERASSSPASVPASPGRNAISPASPQTERSIRPLSRPVASPPPPAPHDDIPSSGEESGGPPVPGQ